MRRLTFCGFLLLLSCAAATLWGQALQLPDGPGKATTERVCSACHGAELVIGRQETREGWGAIVNEMIQRGATGTDADFYEVVDYLATHFSKSSPVVKINVNKASASDLEKALRLSDTQAAAIVKQREQAGDFKTIQDLEKVPGIEAGKIEANKNRLAF